MILLLAHQQGHKATTYVQPDVPGGRRMLAGAGAEPRWSSRWRRFDLYFRRLVRA